MINLDLFIEDCYNIRKQSPLVLSITNYVAMNFNANSLLAIGASPIMSFYKCEMSDLANKCNALVVNIGCLDTKQIGAMLLAVNRFRALGKPWVLDPVGVGASRIRTKVARLLLKYGPKVIRANASEIATLAGSKNSSRGVDSLLNSEDVVEAAKRLASKYGSVVSMSGETDYITDGQRVESIKNGHRLMPKVTAMGCTSSALTAAFLSVDEAFEAAVNAMALMGVAGEMAAKKANGNASLEINFVDELCSFVPEEYSKLIRQ